MFLRLYLFYRSYGLFLIFVMMNVSALLIGYFFPLIRVVGDNPNTVYYFDIPLGVVVFSTQLLLLLVGSFYYIRRNRKNARTIYNLALLVYLSQVITITTRYILLIREISINPYEDEIEVYLGPYIYFMAIIVAIGIVFRLLYIGIERRNSVYLVK